MYLLTKWFGTFLLDESEIKRKILFPKNSKAINKRLDSIENNLILNEEKKIVKNLDKKDVLVCEKRLSKIGTLDSKNTFFKKVDINSEDYNYPKDILQEILLSKSKKEINNNLESTDLQIIQMINTVDDFIHIQNLLNERFTTWSEINSSEKRMKPLKKSIQQINEDIKKLEKQIEVDMKNIAPNLSSIVGPLIGARLISYSGGLKKLALLPSSTIQVLGAEKALFRFKKQGGKPPKHGIIFQLSDINKAPKSKRGKIARNIAAKLSIASRADAFTNRDVSKELKKEINEKVSEIRNH